MTTRAAQFFDSAFARYAVTSALATTTDFCFAHGFHGLGFSPGLATLLGCVAGGAVAFVLARRWAFRARQGRRLPQVLRFVSVWAASALLNSVGVALLASALGSFSVAWVLVRGTVYLGWNYPASRWLVFRHTAHGAPVSSP